MSELGHILDRGIIHFFSSAGVLLCCFCVLRFVHRKKQWAWLPGEFRAQLLFAAICVFAGSALREAFDVAGGQSLAKAVTDYLSWFLGCGVSTWGLWRLRSF